MGKHYKLKLITDNRYAELVPDYYIGLSNDKYKEVTDLLFWGGRKSKAVQQENEAKATELLHNYLNIIIKETGKFDIDAMNAVDEATRIVAKIRLTYPVFFERFANTDETSRLLDNPVFNEMKKDIGIYAPKSNGFLQFFSWLGTKIEKVFSDMFRKPIQKKEYEPQNRASSPFETCASVPEQKLYAREKAKVHAAPVKTKQAVEHAREQEEKIARSNSM